MKKQIKRILYLILSLALATNCILLSSAAEPIASIPESATAETETVRTLSRTEAVNALMERCDLDYNNAVALYSEIVTRGESVQERYVTYSVGAGWSIEVGCLVTVQCGGGHCNFADILEVWSGAIGSGPYTWNEFYSYATVTGTYDDQINFRARGTLEVQVTSGLGGSLEAAGFSLSASVSGTDYFRKTVSVNKTWAPY